MDFSAKVDNQLVWSGSSTYLYKCETGMKRRPKPRLIVVITPRIGWCPRVQAAAMDEFPGLQPDPSLQYHRQAIWPQVGNCSWYVEQNLLPGGADMQLPDAGYR